MKQIITLLALTFTLFTYAGQQTSTGNEANSKNQTAAKQQQAAELKAQCPHYPSFTSSATGKGSTATQLFASWKDKYPNEYSAYLKIFNYNKPESTK